MTHIHSITDYPASGKKMGLLIAVEDNMVTGFPKLNHAHRDAKDLQRLLTGMLSVYLLLFHAR